MMHTKKRRLCQSEWGIVSRVVIAQDWMLVKKFRPLTWFFTHLALYSVIKAQPSEDKEDFSCRSPSVAFSISNPSIGFSLSYPSMNYSDDLSVRSETWESETYSKQRRPHFSSAGQSTSDTISTLGRDDEFFQENSRCSVSSLASDVIRSAAIMLLECNDGCNNEGRDQDYHNVSHRRRHRYWANESNECGVFAEYVEGRSAILCNAKRVYIRKWQLDWKSKRRDWMPTPNSTLNWG